MTFHQFQLQIYPMKDKLFRFARRILEQTEEAEDVVQDVFLRLWKRRDKLDEYHSVEALAMVTAKNLCFDRIRSKRNKTDNIDDYQQLAANLQEPAKPDYSEEIDQVRMAISKLPRKQQIIIHLRDVEGYEFEEIAKLLGMSENTIRVALSRARKKVRELVVNK